MSTVPLEFRGALEYYQLLGNTYYNIFNTCENDIHATKNVSDNISSSNNNNTSSSSSQSSSTNDNNGNSNDNGGTTSLSNSPSKNSNVNDNDIVISMEETKKGPFLCGSNAKPKESMMESAMKSCIIT
jgi:hypothetical protein